MRRLGQHFLKDAGVLSRIVKELDIEAGDTVVEIGPGHGELTKYIISMNPAKIITIEKDSQLAEGMRNKGLGTKVEVIEGDALKILPKLHTTYYSLLTKGYKLAGNIPYYITGKLLRTIGELGAKPTRIVLTVQKEVAQRMAAGPPKMNLLAASVAFWGTPEIVRTVSRNAFRPRPRVQSAVIRITPHKNQKPPEEAARYYAFIRTLFKQPRKTVANNLAAGFSFSKSEVGKRLSAHGVAPGLRPQNLDISAINTLSHDFDLNGL